MGNSKFKISIQTLLDNKGVKLALAGLNQIRLGAMAAARAIGRIGGVVSAAFTAIGGGVKAASDMET